MNQPQNPDYMTNNSKTTDGPPTNEFTSWNSTPGDETSALHVHFRTITNTPSPTTDTMSPSPPTATKLDALIVGAGFSGVYQFKHLRDLGYRVQLVDSATGYGGVWHWNRYPGSRVDTAFPQYQFLDPELVKGWEWSERFPSSKEIRKYFEYVDDKWGLRSGTMFGVTVEKAVWREEERCWEVDGRERDGGKEWKWRCGMLLLNIGFAAKQYIPDWPGQEKFKGELTTLTFLYPYLKDKRH